MKILDVSPTTRRTETAAKRRRLNELLLRRLAAPGLEVTIETDFDAFWRAMQTRPKGDFTNPSFNPAVSDLRPDNAFWVRMAAPNGDVVAFGAAKAVRCGTFQEMLHNLRLWHDKTAEVMEVDGRRDEIELLSDVGAHFGGVVGHSGGIWTRPDWRGHGLTRWLARLMRQTLVERVDDIQYHSAIMLTTLPRTISERYDYPHVELGFRVKPWFLDEVQVWRVGWISRAEMDAEVDRVLAAEEGVAQAA